MRGSISPAHPQKHQQTERAGKPEAGRGAATATTLPRTGSWAGSPRDCLVSVTVLLVTEPAVGWS